MRPYHLSLAGDGSPGVHSGEHAVALQIDDLLGLRERKGNHVIPVVMSVGPNGPVLFRAVGDHTR
jgi:hypothetical protein